MNRNKRSFPFYLALLVILFKITGVSAIVEPRIPVKDSLEKFKASDSHDLWASEEIFQSVKLPEYSEHQFFGSAAIPEGHFQLRKPEFQLLKTSLPYRDLKTHISTLIFPFHFFL